MGGKRRRDGPMFRRAWDAIYVKRVLGWEANPRVWVIQFRME